MAVHQTGTLKMPKGGKLTAEEIATLTEWIKMGAPWPQSTTPVRVAGQADHRRHAEVLVLPAAQDAHDPASRRTPTWAKTDIDHLVLAKLEEKGLKPAPMADKRTLIRRATLDLTGLPPTPEEIEAFEKDQSPDAFAKVVDRLLASPRYGERWGTSLARRRPLWRRRHSRPRSPRTRLHASRWRIGLSRLGHQAVNDDIPYDHFVKMQLAGDLLDKKPTPDDLKATGFLGGAPWIWDQAEPVQGRADERNERIDAVTRGMLGLTVACARCHDHKYDPILRRTTTLSAESSPAPPIRSTPSFPDSEVDFWREKFTKAEKTEEATQAYNKTASDQLAKALCRADLRIHGRGLAGHRQAQDEGGRCRRRRAVSIQSCWIDGSSSLPRSRASIPTCTTGR